jgi:hypothetical protein
MSQADHKMNVHGISPGRITVVEEDGLRICVRESVTSGRGGPLFSAELTLLGDLREVAVLDGRSAEELGALLPTAVRSFAAAARLRRLTTYRPAR